MFSLVIFLSTAILDTRCLLMSVLCVKINDDDDDNDDDHEELALKYHKQHC